MFLDRETDVDIELIEREKSGLYPWVAAGLVEALRDERISVRLQPPRRIREELARQGVHELVSPAPLWLGIMPTFSGTVMDGRPMLEWTYHYTTIARGTMVMDRDGELQVLQVRGEVKRNQPFHGGIDPQFCVDIARETMAHADKAMREVMAASRLRRLRRETLARMMAEHSKLELEATAA